MIVRSPSARRRPPWWVRRWNRPLPRGLYARTILILVIPTILMLCVATFVFFDRHWDTVTRRLTHAVAGEIDFLIEDMNRARSAKEREHIILLAEERLDLFVSFSRGEKLQRLKSNYTGILKTRLKRALEERVGRPFIISLRHAPALIAIQVEDKRGVYTFLLPEKRIYTPTTEIFIGWLLGSSFLLSFIAIIFMRNQVRPIRHLAKAAEAMGKGQDVPWYKPRGAIEVRQAGTALILMRDRLQRQVTQRMAMLSGVSHDLRTPLTRMRLQLALMKDTPETEEFIADITEMEHMLDAYLAFVRGEESEPIQELDLKRFVEAVVVDARRQGGEIAFHAPETRWIAVRENAMKRCLHNLLGNALRYGNYADVSLVLHDDCVEIIVDDDGTGIPENMREDVFKPFQRLDESRNIETGGVGLGLTIARDIARAHGGDVSLHDSPLGGLRAKVSLPL